MRLLTVDIGTNSILHLIVDIREVELRVIERGLDESGLGAGITPDGLLSEELLGRNRQVLQRIVQKANAVGVERAAAVGTAALRMAVNREDYNQMAAEAGLPVEIVSGIREARLAWRGVFGLYGAEQRSGLLDLGGGSTELSIGIGREPDWTESLAIGSVNLARTAFSRDPPTVEDVVRAQVLARSHLSGWRERWRSGLAPRLIGSAGTVTALAAIHNKIITYRHDELTGKVLSFDEVSRWSERLLRLDYEQRRALPGMPSVRARFIHGGVLLLREIMEVLEVPVLEVSDRGVMFGMAWELADMTAKQNRD
ncbi:MAG: hypothetical protein FJY67_08800 [Calditrichaeota bacterium]|nr:hypothetical protein [Calditrichota bacterium]